MENWIIIALVLCIVGGIVFYLRRANKRGKACIGCPYAKQCAKACGSRKKAKRTPKIKHH